MLVSKKTWLFGPIGQVSRQKQNFTVPSERLENIETRENHWQLMKCVPLATPDTVSTLKHANFNMPGQIGTER